jgi:hypothetical protein
MLSTRQEFLPSCDNSTHLDAGTEESVIKQIEGRGAQLSASTYSSQKLMRVEMVGAATRPVQGQRAAQSTPDADQHSVAIMKVQEKTPPKTQNNSKPAAHNTEPGSVPKR